MHPAALENIVPGLAQARAMERHFRGLAFAGLAHRVCGVKVPALQPRHRLALQIVGNAFATDAGAAVTRAAIVEFLWFLHPKCDLPRISPTRALAHWRLRRHARRLNIDSATLEIRRYIATQLQDSSTNDIGPASGGDSPDYSGAIHWMAAEAGFWIGTHGGFTFESYLRTPYLVLQQLERAWRIAHPPIRHDEHTGRSSIDWPQFRNFSDRLVTRWHRDNAATISEKIRAQRDRLENN